MKKIIAIVQALLVTLCIFLPLSAVENQDENVSWTIDGLTRSKDTVSYTRRQEVSKIMIDQNLNFPDYNISLDLKNACAPVAGTNLIGYYSTFYPELISGFKSYTYNANGKKVYNSNRDYTNPIAETLYKSMKTNQSSSGTTVANFKNGIKDYVGSKNLKVSNESSFGALNLFFSLDKYKAFIKENKPVVITAKNLSYIWEINFSTATTKNTNPTNTFTDTFALQNVSPSHIMIGYGYVKYEYYRYEEVCVWCPVWYNLLRFVKETQEVNFRTDEYLLVSFGNGTLGYLNINKSTITDAFTLHISK